MIHSWSQARTTGRGKTISELKTNMNISQSLRHVRTRLVVPFFISVIFFSTTIFSPQIDFNIAPKARRLKKRKKKHSFALFISKYVYTKMSEEKSASKRESSLELVRKNSLVSLRLHRYTYLSERWFASSSSVGSLFAIKSVAPLTDSLVYEMKNWTLLLRSHFLLCCRVFCGTKMKCKWDEGKLT